ncbi:SpaA isopeptide-forming pilin-related protein [Arcanobacterium hippocoleae]|uniref:SpaA isopeptide-forming pilin-related protein n=1 Tax=Arcanobacterium hippocoleae TaxID=149017 RepID=UPI003340191F
MKSTLPALIGKRIVSAFIALLMLLSAIAVAVVSGVEKASAAPTTTTHTIEESSEIIPLEEVKFPLQLGELKQDESLDVKSIDLDPQTKKPVIIWTYTAKVTNGLIVKNQEIERFFSTSLASGLGQPEIVKITKNNNPLTGTGTTTHHDSLLYSVKDHRKGNENNGDDIKTGTYVYTIKTPVLEPRQQYVLNVMNRVTAPLPKDTLKVVDGKPEILNKEETVIGHSYLNFNLDTELNPVLYEYVSKTPQRMGIAADGANVAGYYTSRNQIRWAYSYLNASSTVKDHTIALNFDESHTQNGPAKLYFYKPGKNGYDFAEERPVTTKTASFVLEPGWRVQLVVESTVKDDTKKHSFSGAVVDSLKTVLKINKNWHSEVPQDAKVETTFSVEGNGKILDLKIPAGDSSVSLPGLDTYDADFNKIRYYVSENPVAGMTLYNQISDTENYTYTFYNRKQLVDDPISKPIGNCTIDGKKYGVFELTTTDINQYWLKEQRYATGGALKGKFRVPANSTGGDHFILQLPPELKLEYAADSTWAIGDLYKPGSNGNIGRMYYIGGNKVKFVLWDSATHSQDYEGWFQIGRHLKNDRIITVNGRGGPKAGEEYHWGLRDNPDLVYDPANPKAEFVQKQLIYTNTYIGLNGSGEPCTHTIPKWTTFHFEDDGIAKIAGAVNKYVTKETDDSISWRTVFMASGFNWPHRWYHDHLSETISLYHGNNAASLPKDVKIYVGTGLRNGGVKPDTLIELWPNRAANAPSHLSVKGVVLKDYNGEAFPAISGHKKVKLNKNVEVEIQGKTNETIVMDVHTRKGKTHTDGYYFNESYVRQPGGLNNTHQASYHATTGIGMANFGNFVNINLMKVNEAGYPVKHNPGTFRLYHSSGIYSTKVTSDENGVITFKDVPPKGVQPSGGPANFDGEYNLLEDIPPSGYQAARGLRIRVTAEDVSGKKVPHIEILGNFEQVFNDSGQLIKENITPFASGDWRKGKKFPGTLKYDQDKKPLFCDPRKPSCDSTIGLYPLVNKRIPHVAIKKVDRISKAPLRGAVLRVQEYALQGFNPANPGTPKRTMLMGCTDPEASNLDACVNANVDEFHIYTAKLGSIYIFEEVKAPEGYDQRTEKIYLKLVQDTQTKEYKFVQVDPKNLKSETNLNKVGDVYYYQLENKRSNKIEFTKVNRAGEKIIDPNAQFALYQQSQQGVQGVKEITLADGKQKMYLLKVKDTERRIASSASFKYENLADGTYYLMEDVAPDGFIKPTYPVATFSVKGKSVQSDMPDNKLEITNHPVGRFKVFKTDDSANPQPLANVGFTLYRDEKFTDPVGSEKRTEQSGALYFENLQPGTYWLKETAVPSGYQGSNPVKVVVTEEGKH